MCIISDAYPPQRSSLNLATVCFILDPSSGSAAATVVRAHVHPAPAASQLPVSESIADVQPAPPEPASQAPAPVHAPAQQQVPQMAADSPPEPISEPPAQDELPRLPSTPPPSPEIQHAAEGKHAPHQEPEENSESDIQNPSGDTGAGRKEAVVVVTSPQEQQQQRPVPQSGADHLQAAAATKPSLFLTSVSSDVSGGSSVLTLTPEKQPVQDTTPPAHKVPLQPQMSTEHTAAQASNNTFYTPNHLEEKTLCYLLLILWYLWFSSTFIRSTMQCFDVDINAVRSN